MLIITVTRPLVSSMLSTSPSKFSKVPSLIFTRSPSRKAIFSLGAFSLFSSCLATMRCHLVRQHRAGMAGGAGEVADARRLADQEPRVVVDLHVDDQVARIELPLDDPLLPALELRDFFRRHDHLAEIVSQSGDGHPPQQPFADRLLAVALHLEDVPIHLVRFRLLYLFRRRRRFGFRRRRAARREQASRSAERRAARTSPAQAGRPLPQPRARRAFLSAPAAQPLRPAGFPPSPGRRDVRSIGASAGCPFAMFRSSITPGFLDDVQHSSADTQKTSYAVRDERQGENQDQHHHRGAEQFARVGQEPCSSPPRPQSGSRRRPER